MLTKSFILLKYFIKSLGNEVFITCYSQIFLGSSKTLKEILQMSPETLFPARFLPETKFPGQMNFYSLYALNTAGRFLRQTAVSNLSSGSLITSPLLSIPKKNLVIYQGRHKVVAIRASPDIPVTPTLNPFLPIPSQHDIVRVSTKKEWILLENDGVLKVLVRFNISDRKKLNVTNKTRKLSLEYKVVTNDLKRVLKDFIDNGLSTPIGSPFFAGVKNVIQVFSGSYNGVKLTVPISSQEFNSDLAQRINGQDNTNNYLKVITYKFHQTWLNTINQTGGVVVLTQPRQNIGSAPVTVNAVRFNAQEPSSSSGLFLFKTAAPLFTNETNVPQEELRRDIQAEPDLEGRTEPLDSLLETNTVSAENETNTNSFSYFTTLPVAFSIVEREQFALPTVSAAGPLTQLTNAIDTVRDFINASRSGTTTSSNSISSNTIFGLDPALYSIASSSPGTNEKIEKHELIISERKTDFYLDQFDSISSGSEANMVFSYFENQQRYERCYCDARFLAACIDSVLLQHVRKTHSMRIIYNSIQFDSFQKKNWFNREEPFCKKTPLKNIGSKTVAFNALVSGEYPGQAVNTTATLMFTADFRQTQGVFYRTNRFISCSSFLDQENVQNLAVRGLWRQLEIAFGAPIALSNYPTVALIPCFSRGEIIQVSDTVLFKGLASNSGNNDGF